MIPAWAAAYASRVPYTSAPTSPFQLGRMRELDRLALYFELNPGTHGGAPDPVGHATAPGILVNAILAGGTR